MKLQASAEQARRFLLTFDGDDLSTDRSSQRIRVPQGCTRASVYIGCTATDTPVGVLKPKHCGSVTDAGTEIVVTAMAVSGATTIKRTGIELDGATHFAVDYDWTSDGDGAVFTDHTGAAGTVPFVVFY